jgi:hypothetical protein
MLGRTQRHRAQRSDGHVTNRARPSAADGARPAGPARRMGNSLPLLLGALSGTAGDHATGSRPALRLIDGDLRQHANVVAYCHANTCSHMLPPMPIPTTTSAVLGMLLRAHPRLLDVDELPTQLSDVPRVREALEPLLQVRQDRRRSGW